MSQTDWIRTILDLCQNQIPHVLVTIVKTKGSAPRDAGTRMIVREEIFSGTVGGGNLEWQILHHARDALIQKHSQPFHRSFELGAALGQCCGGVVEVLFEPWLGPVKPIAIFGAGHVGSALVKLLYPLPRPIFWFDSRQDSLPPFFQEGPVSLTFSDDLPVEIASLPPQSSVVILTHNHDLDFRILLEALKRKDLAYLGVIGSKAKAVRFRQRLLQKGFSEEESKRFICPIGILEIRGKHPAEIALAIASQIYTGQA